MARFARIEQQPRRLADQVYDQLLDAILSGEINAGERLIQETLAEEMTVSRTPVREALLRLEREGILEPAPKRGFHVVEFTTSRALNVYEARQAVEGFAARLVAERASDEQLEELRPLLNKVIVVDSFQGTTEENWVAHRALATATQNEALVDLFDSLWERAMMLRIRSDVWFATEERGELTHSHVDVYEAIASRDGDKAEAAMVEHLQIGLDQHMAAVRRREPVGGRSAGDRTVDRAGTRR